MDSGHRFPDVCEGRLQFDQIKVVEVPDLAGDVGARTAGRVGLVEVALLGRRGEVLRGRGRQRVVRAAAHLHGGMGVSREYPPHRYYV